MFKERKMTPQLLFLWVICLICASFADILCTKGKWSGNGTCVWHIVPSWVIFVPHVNIIHEIGNKTHRADMACERWTEWNQYMSPQLRWSGGIIYYNNNNKKTADNDPTGRNFLEILTHWGRVMHICICNLTIIGSENGLSPGGRQAIIWTNDGI